MTSKKFPTSLVVKLVAEVSTEAFGLASVTKICGLVCLLKPAVVVSAFC